MRGDKTSKGKNRLQRQRSRKEKRHPHLHPMESIEGLGHRQDLRAGLAQEGVV